MDQVKNYTFFRLMIFYLNFFKFFCGDNRGRAVTEQELHPEGILESSQSRLKSMTGNAKGKSISEWAQSSGASPKRISVQRQRGIYPQGGSKCNFI
jgi:hypothetical protein